MVFSARLPRGNFQDLASIVDRRSRGQCEECVSIGSFLTQRVFNGRCILFISVRI